MSQSEESPRPARSGYRFGDVLVDVTRRRLLVRGREVRCRPLPFDLLLLLCESGGAVVTREQVFQRLWGDSHVPSDESLTQIVHRLRAALGPFGSAVRTVRGVGLRLDIPVARLSISTTVAGPPDLSTRPLPAPAPVAEPVPEPVRRPRSRALALAVLLALVLVLAGWMGWAWLSRPDWIDEGYALRVSDLGTSSDETLELLRSAFAAHGRGDGPRALELLRTAHRTDPDTPVPAVFLSLWTRSLEPDAEARRWAGEAERRLAGRQLPYLRLLSDYARDRSPSRAGSLSALLSLRPEAWQLRLARAHHHLARRRREAALADLRQIPVRSLEHQGQAIALADRASLGDLKGAERDFEAGGPPKGALASYVEGRFAWSHGQAAEAMAAFDRSAAEALRDNQPDLVPRSLILAALAAFEADDPAGAALRLDQAAATARDSGRSAELSDALGLGAYLAWRRGDAAGRDRRLAEACASEVGCPILQRAALTLLAQRIGGALPADPARLAGRIELLPEALGLPSLLLARAAAAAGKPEEAARLLLQAKTEGIGQTWFAEEAALLGYQLGGPPEPSRVDPPYPNRLRITAAWEAGGGFSRYTSAQRRIRLW